MWEVVIRTEVFRANIYIFRETMIGHVLHREMLHVNADGSTFVDAKPVDYSVDYSPAPTISINLRDQGILSGLAGQLAQMGFGALSATPVVNAQEKHIKSLETEAERLFLLAQAGLHITHT